MQPSDIERLIKAGLPNAEAYVEGDGTHFNALVVSSEFTGKSRIQKQQMVYDTVRAQLMDGTLHALSVKALTPEECQAIDHDTEGDQ
jgi:acid stress-induced BolA-like protein IbaG/YrbA